MRPSGTTRGVRRGERAVDHAVGRDDAGEEHLGDHLDDAGAAHAGDAARPSAKPGSSDQASAPITRNRGSSVSGSMRTRSIAPGAARWPQLICAPSNAGPGRARGREQPVAVARARSRRSCRRRRAGSRSSWSCGASDRIMPAVSAPTWPAMHGSTYTRAPGFACEVELRGAAARRPRRWRARTARRRARVGSRPRNEVVHDRVADEREVEHVGAVGVGRCAQLADQPVDALADDAR